MRSRRCAFPLGADRVSVRLSPPLGPKKLKISGHQPSQSQLSLSVHPPPSGRGRLAAVYNAGIVSTLLII
ncbi:hypothetical protein SDJN03_14573, partial [Cucurbita argyrosperma subsp. sororia]